MRSCKESSCLLLGLDRSVRWHLSICVPPPRSYRDFFLSFNRKYMLKRIFTAFFRLDLSRTPLKSLWKSHGHGLRSLAAGWVSGCDHILHLRRNMALERRTSLTPCPQMDGSNWFCLGPSGSDDPVLRDGLFQLITAENLEVQYYLVFSFFLFQK